MKKKHLRCLLVLLVAVCMVCSIAVPVCAEVLPSAQIGTPETALESDTEKDNTPTPTPTDTPTPEPAPSEAPSTPETSEPAATSETAAPAAPSLDEITTMLYSDLPDAPTGYYIGEYGLPVGTGQTKISLSAWQDELLDESSQGRLDADALNTDTSAMAVAKQPGQDYAIVPIVMQVEYPANGSATTVTLPDDVDLLSYASTEDHLVTASEEERAQILTGSYTDASASAKYISYFARRSRKYNACIGVATQQLGDCLDESVRKYSSPIINMSSFKFLFYSGQVDLQGMQEALKLTDGEAACISVSNKRHCLLKAGNGKYYMEIGTLPFEAALFGDKGGV